VRATQRSYPIGTQVMVKIGDEPWQPATVVGYSPLTTYRGEYTRFRVRIGHPSKRQTVTVNESKIRPVGLVPSA
jgi:hypothetical protein